ncbi:MAG: MFS transporter, partial [bacterium]|nr:MFS transporter [bacterium]
AMLAPIFALFIEGFIEGGNEQVAGISVALFLITKSLFQIPIATLLDRIRGEKDDFAVLVTFSLLMSLTPLLYLLISQPWQLYLVQILLGFFTAMTFPSFMAIFTRHIDKSQEGTEWGIYFTLSDLVAASLAAIGGYIAYTIGFHVLIMVVVSVSSTGSLMLLSIKPYIRKR